MDFFRSSRSRFLLFLGVILIALTFSIWTLLSSPAPRTVTPGSKIMNVDMERGVAVTPSQENRTDTRSGFAKEPMAIVHDDEKTRSARGAGFAIGKMLRDLYINQTVTEQGKKHMDISEFAAASARTPRPVDMNDATAPSALRAELCSSIVAGSLDLTSVDQQKLAGILAESYAADSSAGALDETARKELRERLSKEAFARIRAVIPPTNQGDLDAFIERDSFLFSISIKSDSIRFSPEDSALRNSTPATLNK